MLFFIIIIVVEYKLIACYYVNVIFFNCEIHCAWGRGCGYFFGLDGDDIYDYIANMYISSSWKLQGKQVDTLQYWIEYFVLF